MGNLKFDIAPPSAMLELGNICALYSANQRPVFLAASTREGEESLLLDALQHAEIEQSAHRDRAASPATF